MGFQRRHTLSEWAGSTSGRPGRTKKRHGAVHHLRDRTPALLGLFLLSVVVVLGLRGGPTGAAPLPAASGSGAVPSVPTSEAENLTTPEALAGLQSVPETPLNGISCVSKMECVAVGDSSNAGGAYVVITNGIPGPVEAVPNTSALTSVDCVSATTCYASGNAPYVNPAGQSTTGGVIATITSGDSVAVNIIGVPPVALGDPGYMDLAGIGCSGTSACVATGYTQALGGFAVTVRSGVPGDHLVVTGSLSTRGAECVKGGSCLLDAGTLGEVGSGREATFGLDSSVKIGGKGHLSLGLTGGIRNTTLNGGACHDNDLAVLPHRRLTGPSRAGVEHATGAVDVADAVTSSRNTEVPGTNSLTDISCAGTYWCIATGQNTAGEGVLVPIGWDTPATPVLATGTFGLSAVSCVPNGLCVAAGSGPGNGGVVDSFRVWNGQ